MTQTKKRKKISPVLLSGLLAIGLFCVLLLLGNLFLNSNLKAQYYFGNIKSKIFTHSVADRIIIAEIDDRSFNALQFPFDRADYAPVLKNLYQAGVATVGIDIIFEDPSDNPESDIAFGQAITQAGNTLIGFNKTVDGKPLKPLGIIGSGSITTGYFNVGVTQKGYITHLQPSLVLRDKKQYDYFPLAVLKSADGYEDYQSKYEQGDYVLSPLYSIPLSDITSKSIRASYLPQDMFTRVSFLDLYESESFTVLSKKVDFKDSIVLIGVTGGGTKDTFYTPNGKDYGVYVHANMINTLLQGYHTQYFNTDIEKLLLFILLFLGCYFNIKGKGIHLIASNIAVITIFLLLMPLVVLLFTDLILNYYIQFIVGLVGALVSSNIAKYLLENKDKNKLNTALGEYVSKEVSNEILNGSGEVDFDGESKNIVMFFSDIEGFTTLSEKFSPEKLVYFLREYLGEMSHIIMDQRGFINKYEGDAIMALWGAFGKNDNIVHNACVSALQQQERLSILNKKWADSGEFEPFQVRMGIHSGDAILGNIGAKGRKLEFTALGDNVNLASRLEGINKYYSTYLCVSEDVYNAVGDDFEFRYLDNIRVKGKSKPIKIYELLCVRGELSPENGKIIDKFYMGLDSYIQKDFSTAFDIFNKLTLLGDGPSKTYLERCEEFMQNPPPKNWDQIWTFDSK